MDWPAWRPTYEAILADFGFDRAADEAARDELDALLADRLRWDPPALRGEAVILGGAWDGRAVPDGPLLVADPRAPPPRQPTAVVTDLDGDISLQVALNAVGVPLVVHAHGDNRAALARHVPRLPGPVMGTTQAEPRGRVRGFGGFSDGDRAACLAVALGATSLTLVGFDWTHPAQKPARDAATKARKLAWARRVVEGLGVPLRYA
ncbi:MAG: 2-amino-4-hydroxy-6-hydroxymethyldihydropteridine diphosphokinase [Thermoplasmata archaeon]|jgi:uncharacterized Rossmann fold enzyme|nr:2-amino-4-hydroxy-6-hydroxymethyldihydropteridine diphosphokinase [Thermoplasmata archaeon]